MNYEWEPDESWRWNYKNSVKSVYELLYIYEELTAYYDSDNPDKVYCWVMRETQKLTERQTQLFDYAFNEKIRHDGPLYHRPSIFLLDQLWMDEKQYKKVKNGFKSQFFIKSGFEFV